MVKYYGRARSRTGAVNTTQLGLKMQGCPNQVGRQTNTVFTVNRRVNCILKVCGWRPRYGVYHRKPAVFNFPGKPTDPLALEAWSGPYPCIMKAPRHQPRAGGVGHVWSPRDRCGVNCEAECEGLSNIIFPQGADISDAPECVDPGQQVAGCCFHVFEINPGIPGAAFLGRPWRNMIIDKYFTDTFSVPQEAILPPSIPLPEGQTSNGGFGNRCWSLYDGDNISSAPGKLNFFQQLLGGEIIISPSFPDEPQAYPLIMPSSVNGNGLYEPWAASRGVSGPPMYAWLPVPGEGWTDPAGTFHAGSLNGWLLAFTARSTNCFGPISCREDCLTLYWWTSLTCTSNPDPDDALAPPVTFMDPGSLGTLTNTGVRGTAWPVVRLARQQVQDWINIPAFSPAIPLNDTNWSMGLDNCGCPCLFSGGGQLVPFTSSSNPSVVMMAQDFNMWTDAKDEGMPAVFFGPILHPQLAGTGVPPYDPADKSTFQIIPNANDNQSWGCSTRPNIPPCECGTSAPPEEIMYSM